MRRPLLVAALVLAVGGGLAVGLPKLHVAASVGTGYAAKVACSLVLNSGQDPEAVLRDYVAHEVWPLGPAIRLAVDREGGAVEASSLGLVRARAIHRDGIGCTLLADVPEEEVRRQWVPPPRRTGRDPRRPWPDGAAGPAEAPPPAVVAAVDGAFAEPEGTSARRQTKAVVVVHRGRLVAERYAPGVGPETPMLSWSMAKSVLAALVGIAAGEGLLDLEAPAPVLEWRGAGDPRGAITVAHLLRMRSGLAFDEHYGAINDVSRMLFTRGDMGAFAASFPLAAQVGSVWSYSSGTTNILARALRHALGGELADSVRFARERLFEPTGMHGAFFEADASGSFVGSSFAFAPARDWARFGELHLRDGVWGGRRVLPEGWVARVTRPTPQAPEGGYGAHWWLNAGDPDAPARRMWPSLPRDTYAARGHSGQYVVVVPSAELVVVRLGLSQADGDALHGIEPLVAALLAALAPPQGG